MSSPEQEIVWKDPPSSRRGRGPSWPSRLAPLMEKPGEWAMVKVSGTPGGAYETATRLKCGIFQIPPGRWEFTGAKNGAGGEVYARYLGPDTDGGE